jgi:hypothetical protein
MQRAACLVTSSIAHPDGELAEVANPVRRRLILRRLPIDFEKTGYLAHIVVLFT